MNHLKPLRILAPYLTLALFFACAREENAIEDDSDSGGGKTNVGAAGAGATTSKGGSGNGLSGASTGGAGGKTSMQGQAGKAGSAGASGAGTAGGGGNGGAAVGGTGGAAGSGGAPTVPPDVLQRASVIVYYETSHTSAMDGTIQMKLHIKNQSPDALPMVNVKIRYWFTAEVTPELHQYYTGPQAQQPKAAFVNDGAESHALMTFGGGSIVQGGDMNASEVQLELTNNSAKFNQADDFSWQPADTVSAPNDKITLYLDDELIWGCEPGGSCFGDGTGGAPGNGGAGGAP